jgi:hypothetical protein
MDPSCKRFAAREKAITPQKRKKSIVAMNGISRPHLPQPLRHSTQIIGHGY